MINIKEEEVYFLETPNETITGYEQYYDDFNKLFKEYHATNSKDIKDKIVEEVVNIYHSKKLFPMLYVSKEAMIKEIKSLAKKDFKFDGENLKVYSNLGNKTCRNISKNIHLAKGMSGESGELNGFCNFKKMKTVVNFVMKSGEVPLPHKVRRAIALANGSVQNFLPSRAKSIYDYFCKDGDVVYDYSAGFGGRMFGAATSLKDITYIGVEPNSITYNNLLKLKNLLEETLDKKNKINIYKNVSEDFILPNDSIDFAFSSPPYFDLEVYSDEPTQCYNKFNQYDAWINGYVYPTMINIKNALKSGGTFAVNIANNKKHNLLDDWKTVCEDIGLEYNGSFKMILSQRPGAKNIKYEEIALFKKL